MNVNRVLFAGVKSGCGKTTAVCIILSLLKKRGINVKAFKCGPDYIDPMFHRAVLDIPSRNLDPFFSDSKELVSLLSENRDADISVIEGTMGYYDGTGEHGCDNSTYTVAKETKTPVILVIDASGSFTSLLAQIEGFARYMKESCICGVLFNKMKSSVYPRIKKLLDERFKGGIVSVGYIPPLPKSCTIPSRHLGLFTPDEINDMQYIVDMMCRICSISIDIDSIILMSLHASGLMPVIEQISSFESINIAVAYDQAFCFYYYDTLRLFEKMGANLLYFSPLLNEAVPSQADALLLGGGYPELYSELLEINMKTKISIQKSVFDGMPVIAECGGFMYLGKTLSNCEMCSLLPCESYKTDKLVRFGYIDISSKSDGLFGPEGTVIKAHEFHYYDCEDSGNSFSAKKPDGKSWECSFYGDTLYAGFPHLYLNSNISAAKSFYQKALEYRKRKNTDSRRIYDIL